VRRGPWTRRRRVRRIRYADIAVVTAVAAPVLMLMRVWLPVLALALDDEEVPPPPSPPVPPPPLAPAAARRRTPSLPPIALHRSASGHHLTSCQAAWNACAAAAYRSEMARGRRGGDSGDVSDAAAAAAAVDGERWAAPPTVMVHRFIVVLKSNEI